MCIPIFCPVSWGKGERGGGKGEDGGRLSDKLKVS